MKNRAITYYLMIASWTIFLSCNHDTTSEEIIIGNTVKACSSFNPDVKSTHDLTYYWSYEKKPISSTAQLIVDNDKVLFTPDLPGDYVINCSVMSPNNLLHDDTFLYKAITRIAEKRIPVSELISDTDTDSIMYDLDDHGEMSLPEHLPEKDLLPLTGDISNQSTTSIESALYASSEYSGQGEHSKISMPELLIPGKGKYVLQISSWHKEEFADNQIGELVSEGILAYKVRMYDPEADLVWYRVRLGDFKKYKDAEIAVSIIRPIIDTEIWIDNVKTRN